jgi:hypothetical protein
MTTISVNYYGFSLIGTGYQAAVYQDGVLRYDLYAYSFGGLLRKLRKKGFAVDRGSHLLRQFVIFSHRKLQV